jgi:GH15 family glucan-1,4-alpha-glucosidase
VAETFELILALTKMGDKDKARMVLDWVLQFRDSDGVFYREVYWPQGEIRQSELKPQAHEKNTWTSAAAILAMVALDGVEIP